MDPASEPFARRIWRLALLLTDSPRAADAIVRAAVRDEPELVKVGDTRLDRFALQSARDWAARRRAQTPEPAGSEDAGASDSGGAGDSGGDSGGGVDSGGADALGLAEEHRPAWRAIADLPDQPREAVTLLLLDELDPIRAARAMDCSRTALETVHLPAARAVLRDTLALPDAGASLDAALAPIVGAAARLDTDRAVAVADRVAERARRRRRTRSVLMLTALFVCFGLLLYVLFDLLSWDEERDAEREIVERFSNPKPEKVDPDAPWDGAPPSSSPSPPPSPAPPTSEAAGDEPTSSSAPDAPEDPAP